ncbi:MAG: hypothetical protein J5679_01050 [Alphaproteobacteria bacterium]|nr:hypothetical protein [Alphaproteobacteria bacterium]
MTNVHCTEDVCNLILQPEYTMKSDPLNKRNVQDYVLTAHDFGNRIHVSFNRRFVEIYVFENKNSKYYEKLSLDIFAEQFKADKIKRLLTTKVEAFNQRHR